MKYPYFKKLDNGNYQQYLPNDDGTVAEGKVYRLCRHEDGDNDNWRSDSVVIYTPDTMEVIRIVPV